MDINSRTMKISGTSFLWSRTGEFLRQPGITTRAGYTSTLTRISRRNVRRRLRVRKRALAREARRRLRTVTTTTTASTTTIRTTTTRQRWQVIVRRVEKSRSRVARSRRLPGDHVIIGVTTGDDDDDAPATTTRRQSVRRHQTRRRPPLRRAAEVVRPVPPLITTSLPGAAGQSLSEL